MTAVVTLTGRLFRAPELHTPKDKQPYVTTEIAVNSGDDLHFWTAFARSAEARSELLRLMPGVVVCVQGPLQIEQFERGNKTQVAFTVTIERVLLPQPSTERGEAP